MDEINKGPRIGKRHIQIFSMFVLFAIANGMRAQLSVALVAMTERSTSNSDIPVVVIRHTSPTHFAPVLCVFSRWWFGIFSVYDWDNKSVILSSFYWGYVWLQILAGNLGRVYGTKYFLIVSMIINATLCCLIPNITMKWGSYGLIVVRVLQGLSQGFFYPCINDVVSKWSPSSERARLGTFAFSGANFGNIITMPLVAVISTTWYGWPLSFYLFGCLGYLWVIVFYFVGVSSPGSHPSISKVEREYIQRGFNTEGHKETIPWSKILCNRPFWAVFITQMGLNFCELVLLLETPTYLNKVMEFDLTSSGFLSSAPDSCNLMSLILFSHMADYLINNNILSVTWTRKLFNAIGSLIPAASMLILGFLSKDVKTVSVIMLIVASASQAACGSGSDLNHIDLSPNFAAVLIGIINCIGTLVSIFGPLSVQFIVKDETDIKEWRIIFILAACIFLITFVVFVCFGSAEVQPFDSSKEIEGRKNSIKKL